MERFNPNRIVAPEDREFFESFGKEAEEKLKSEDEQVEELIADFNAKDYPGRMLLMEECESVLYDGETVEARRAVLVKFVTWAKPQMPGESRELF